MISVSNFLEKFTFPPEGWKIGAELPVPRLESGCVTVDNQLYVFGGFSFKLRATKRVDVYDPQTDRWRQVADMPTPVTHLNAALDGDNIWFAGGFVGDHPGVATEQVWKYALASNCWSEGLPLPIPRAGGTLERVGRELHYFGGFAADRDTTCPDHWALSLDGGTQWVERAPLPDPRGHLSSIVLDEKIYALGGQHRHDTNPEDVASCHIYDPQRDIWKELACLPEPRSHFEPGIFIFNGQIIIVGGRNNNKPLPIKKNLFNPQERQNIDDLPYQLYLSLTRRQSYIYSSSAITAYDPTTNIWTELTSLPISLISPVANVIRKQLIVTGGGRDWKTPGSRTLLNETLLDLVKSDAELS